MKPYLTNNFQVSINESADPQSGGTRVEFKITGRETAFDFWWPTLVSEKGSKRQIIAKAKANLSHLLGLIQDEVVSDDTQADS